MKLSGLFALTGVLGMLFGLEFLLIPEMALQQYGVPTEPHNLMQARYFGSTLLAFGLMYWLLRGTRDDATRRSLLLVGVVGNLVALVLSVWTRLEGLQGILAWLSVAIYGVLLLGSLNFLFRPGQRD